MRFKAVLIIFFLAILKINASPDFDTIIIKSDNSTDRIARDLDSLVNTWYVKLAIKNMSDFNVDTLSFTIADSIYERRLSKINSIISLPFNNIIRNHIEVYTVRQRRKFAAVLGLKIIIFQ